MAMSTPGLRSRSHLLLVALVFALLMTRVCSLHFHSHVDHDSDHATISIAEQGPHIGAEADDVDMDGLLQEAVPTSAHFLALDLPTLIFGVMLLAFSFARGSQEFAGNPRNDRYRPPPRFALPQGRAPPRFASTWL